MKFRRMTKFASGDVLGRPRPRSSRPPAQSRMIQAPALPERESRKETYRSLRPTVRIPGVRRGERRSCVALLVMLRVSPPGRWGIRLRVEIVTIAGCVPTHRITPRDCTSGVFAVRPTDRAARLIVVGFDVPFIKADGR